MAELEQPLTAEDVADEQEPETPEPEGYLLRGVMRFRGHEKRLARGAARHGNELIEHQALAALVRAVPYRLPDWDPRLIQEHSTAVQGAMERSTIVPAPYGIVFQGRDQVTQFLEDQQVALDEALSFLDGAFEMRLHVQPSGRRSEMSESEQADLAAGFYTALRRRSRAAFTLQSSGRRILSAAFLVSRTEWVAFVEYADQLDADHPELIFDLTGPWPAYDFVRMAFLPTNESSG